jgi:hypothetical protein
MIKSLAMRGKLLPIEQANQTEKWKRLLDRLQQKNVVQKCHLAEILKQFRGEDDFVLLAEHYHNRLLQQDEALRLMRNDVAALEDLAIKNECEKIHNHKKKLEREMKAFRVNFKRISSEFTIFLLSVGSLCV